jgi:hypothetical protein
VTTQENAASAGTLDDLASRLYPNIKPAAPAAAAPAAAQQPGRTEAQLADALYGKAEPLPVAEPLADKELQALRDDGAHRMYSVPEAERAVRADIFDGSVGQMFEVDGQSVEFTQESARKAATELRAMAADLALTESEMAAVQDSLAFGQSIKGDAEKIAAARATAISKLGEEFGERAGFAADAARAFVAKNPRLAAVLDRTGAGDSPQVILRIARRAVALHGEGKLTVGGR